MVSERFKQWEGRGRAGRAEEKFTTAILSSREPQWRLKIERGATLVTQEHVLMLTRHYAPEPTGSAPVMQQIAEWLAKHNHQVRVVTVRPNYPGNAIFDGYADGKYDHVIEAGVHIRRRTTRPVTGVGLLSRLGPEASFMAGLWLGRLTGATPPGQRVISLCPSILTTLGALSLVKPGGHHLVIVHDIQSGLGDALGSPGLRAIMPILRLIERAVLNRADHIIVLSEAMAKGLRHIGVDRPISILPPSIDTTFIVPIARAPNARPTLLYSGNLGRKQGLNQLLDLASVLLSRGSNARILIRGEGSERRQLADAAQRRGLSNVDFCQLAPKVELPKALSEADVHLVPQLADGGNFAVPSKIFAIMAAERPFVATAVAGSSLASLAAESGAFLCVPPDAPDAFADAVIELLGNSELRRKLGRRGREYVVREVDTDVVMHKLLPMLAPTSK